MAAKATVKTRKKTPTTTKGSGAKNLVVVESPAKARTIGAILGKEYKITASMGHVRDLPKGKLGIDVENAFQPSYSVMKTRADTVREIKRLGKDAESIYLATDPDREGEAISWHLAAAMGWDVDSPTLRRVVFHEITKDAIHEAFKHSRSLDMDLVNAQQARRILDRLVGYQLSPLLWKKVQRGLSAGRVQSVALRLVVDRETEVQAFDPKEYWTMDAHLAKQTRQFTTSLHSLKGQKRKLELPNQEKISQIEADLKGAEYVVAEVKTTEKRRRPSPPFTTSTLQQEAGRKLRFTARRTMSVAQALYEGLGGRGADSYGLITYMRTDSTALASSAVAEAREYIKERYGERYVPPRPKVYKTRSKGAQEAHEAIRPTSIKRTPESLKGRLTAEQLRLYDLIWKRTLACQMADAVYDATTADIHAGATPGKTYVFRAAGSRSKFRGFTALYLEGRDDDDTEDGKPLPPLAVDDKLDFHKLQSDQRFTKPPPRFTEATLVKLLEEKGIGRPSTYAPILSTLVDRKYVVKDKNRLAPTELGSQVSGLLTEFFPGVMNAGFTASMEDSLDQVARGERPWVPMLEEFYVPFRKTLEEAKVNMPSVKVEEPTDEVCDKCGSPMVIKSGRFGKFMACAGFPECRNTRPVDSDGATAQDEPTDEVCGKCGSPMVIKSGRFGKFMACRDYPGCRTTMPLKTGAQCPRCQGDLVERRGRGRGRLFYGCANYPECDFLVNQRPLPDPCPECGGLMVAAARDGKTCTVCAWKGEPAAAGKRP